ncbi:hypothetical protein BC831DRAFT_517089 [Entophlyctis helioformis]|nr:hypothetical protein BC831DRAFT_517089 [Entophlyctis helioformis]
MVASGILSKILLLLITLATLLSLTGGGLVLTPYRYTSWLVTSYATVGLYGTCPRSTETQPRFTDVADSWTSLQALCSVNPLTSSTDIRQREAQLTPTQQVIASAFHASSLVLTFTALVWPLRQGSTAVSSIVTSAFVIHATGFAFATVYMYGRLQFMRETVGDKQTEFSVGLYLSGAAVLAMPLAVMLAWNSTRKTVKAKHNRWDA